MITEEEYKNLLFAQMDKQYSHPLFECPKCNKNSMCRDNYITLTSYPPKYVYHCLKEYGGCGEYSTTF